VRLLGTHVVLFGAAPPDAPRRERKVVTCEGDGVYRSVEATYYVETCERLLTAAQIESA
jgi:hypothetical protein